MSKNNDLERKALKLVVDAGEEGILQSDLWKSLDVTSREGSRISLKFAEKEVIERRKVLHNGRWTYKLFNLTKYVSLESIKDSPCIVCDEIDKCFVGGQVSPIVCPKLTAWVDPNAKLPSAEPES